MSAAPVVRPGRRILLAQALAATGTGLLGLPASIAWPAAGQPAPGWVGLRVSRFAPVAPRTSPRPRRWIAWYPSAEPDARFEYGDGGQVGRVRRRAEAVAGRHPVLVFSHGFTGAADQSIFITEHLARMGYVVVAPDHVDLGPRPPGVDGPPFLRPQDWSDASHADRRADLAALLDLLEALDADPSSFLHRRLDLGRVGAFGHSLGGYAVLGMAGAREAWRDARLRAVAALSPYALPYLLPGGYGSVGVPALLQGGGYDVGITPELPRLYALLRAPRYFLVLRAENHLGWTNLAALGRETVDVVRTGNPRWIVDYLQAFFDHHLRGIDRSTLLARPNAALQSFVHEHGAPDRAPRAHASPRASSPRAQASPPGAGRAPGGTA